MNKFNFEELPNGDLNIINPQGKVLVDGKEALAVDGSNISDEEIIILQTKLGINAIQERIEQLETNTSVQIITEVGTNLNNYKTTGIYFFNVDVKPTNIPAGSNGWLVVLGGNTEMPPCKQLWFRFGTPGSNDMQTYVRTYDTASLVWGSWIKYTTG